MPFPLKLRIQISCCYENKITWQLLSFVLRSPQAAGALWRADTAAAAVVLCMHARYAIEGAELHVHARTTGTAILYARTIR